MARKMFFLFLGVILVIVLAGCRGDGSSTPKSSESEEGAVMPVETEKAQGEETADMPNPASVYCEEQGGTLEIRTDASGGQSGVCIFADGSECDEWAFFRGECVPGGSGRMGMPNPASVYCEEQGGTLGIRTDASGGQSGVCIFADGSECDEWAFFRGECQPGGDQATPVLDLSPLYVNSEYGFAFSSPAGWTVERHEDQNRVLFHRTMNGKSYFLYVGYLRAGEELLPFRTGMPAGEMIDGASFEIGGRVFTRQLLVFEGKTKVVQYGFNLEVDDLRLFVWLDAEDGSDYRAMDIPAEVMAEADLILGSLMRLEG